MPLPADFYDEGVNYRLRICMKVEDNPLIGLVSGSKVHVCDACGTAIWVQEKQVIPETDVPITADLKVCVDCGRRATENSPDEPQWLGPRPPEWT